MALQWLKGTLAGFKEFASAVKNEIVSLQPKDSDTIRWQRDYDGMSAHLNLDSITGGSSQSISDDIPEDVYRGDFAIESIPTDTPRVFNVRVFSNAPSYYPGYAGIIQNRTGIDMYQLPDYISEPLDSDNRYLFYLTIEFDSSNTQKISSVTPHIGYKSNYSPRGGIFPVLYFELLYNGEVKVLWRFGYDMALIVENVTDK